ncbi:cytochrome P450 monooxygenase-like protein [Lentithecium fluviatile CBS 122367]|uniref:Cytochrome P450 monooxygenase-like protein n=1 Tax=Lentithecium fluviatile CBS 122367 TaxID=1168545 RepID=A0A6G1JM74_9PLEO|nr:cytochrome P450 monooxygenase-like protein [Lentithecium fluviatile CBS 122367]
MSWETPKELLAFAEYAAFAFLLRCIIVYGYHLTFHPLGKYPGPWLVGITDWYSAYYALLSRLHLVTYQCHQKYGAMIRLGPNKLVFNSYKALQDIYQSHRTNKVHSYLSTQLKPNTYNVFNCIPRSLHKIKRRMISKALSEQKLRKFEPILSQHIHIFLQQLLKASRARNPVNMTDRCKRLGTDIIGRYGFGYELNMQTEEANDFVISGLLGVSYMSNVLIQWFPRVYALRMKYYFLLKRMVKQRLAEGKDAKEDLFKYVMDAKDPETGTKFNLTKLVSEATFCASCFLTKLIPEGADTTSTTITAAFFYPSRNPSCYAKLASEIRSTFSSGTEIQSGPLLSSCTYLRAVMDETMRTSPPLGRTLWRELPVDDIESDKPLLVDGPLVPAGTWVGVNMYTIHHNEKYFPEPFAFRPERWLERDSTVREAFVAFGFGPRGCAGKVLAYMEASLTLAKTTWYFDFERPKSSKLDNIGGGTAGNTKGRGHVDEFQIRDYFVSDHNGPFLVFKARDDLWKDLE